jgi:hypothetical protein
VHVHKSHHELHNLTAVGETILLDTSFRDVQELGEGSRLRVGCAYPSRACARQPTWEAVSPYAKCPLNIALFVILVSTESGLGSRSLRIADTDLLFGRTLSPLDGMVLSSMSNPDIGT